VNLADAFAYLDSHTNYDTSGRINSPSTDRMVSLVSAMGDPQTAYPVIHLTGTNGKGSTAQMVTRLLMAHGVKVGTYTSPHLERINERFTIDGEQISDELFCQQIAAIADLELIAGVTPSYFEILTAAAFRWFADEAIDVAVIEVGMLGNWDATNVADGQVCVITNVGLDHADYAGPTLADIAREKSGIIKPGSTVVIGETDPELVAIFRAKPSERVYERDVDFECQVNELALGGRSLDIRTPTSMYGGLVLPLHGEHQGENAAVALTAVEAFFDAPVPYDIAAEAFAQVRWPGRFETIGYQPLVIVDGAHNAHGADRCAEVFFSDFDPAGKRVLLIGCLTERNPRDLLAAFRADEFDLVYCTTAPSPRGLPAADLAAAATAVGCDDVLTMPDLSQACAAAYRSLVADDALLVAGSLYVIGAARSILKSLIP
jgi:dihydrofolate synthase / folylpolyglutamate synthase